jgi:hypothetical protein
MKRRRWAAIMAAIGTLCVVSTLTFARPHDDPTHRSALIVTLTLPDGTQRTATLQGVGCTESMCSRVRALDSRAKSVWLDHLSAVREISHNPSGPVHAVFTFRDGTERAASITDTNRVLYVRDWQGRDRTVDLASLIQIDFD